MDPKKPKPHIRLKLAKPAPVKKKKRRVSKSPLGLPEKVSDNVPEGYFVDCADILFQFLEADLRKIMLEENNDPNQ